ncbi:hypothetical protein K4L44_09935 [Halosquirtibacter laminarini]|uniref:Uncharacterized protein n=1 Tax=Halosquirtibacter laminarini TaxID=3374600 RepID=A0AC61NBP6_9BACT|nr:hypothetical protein K4L44_09935 [Prolixibacteraceae bacterium]
MMKKIYSLLIAVTTILSFSSCESWINDAVTSPNVISEGDMNKPEYFGTNDNGTFVFGPNISSILNKAIDLYSPLYMYVGAMSDEISAPSSPNSLIYRDLSQDNLNVHDGSLRGIWTSAQSLYSMSNLMLGYANQTDWSSSDEMVKNNAFWYCNFYKGMALYNLAAYFNAEVDKTKAPYIYMSGEKVANSAIYQQAIDALKASLKYADATQKRISNTALVRVMVMSGLKDGVAIYADNMMIANDLDITVSHELQDNTFFSAMGENSRDAMVNQTFVDALASLAETNHNPTAINTANGAIIQTRFGQYSPQVIVSYVEAEMLRAELILDGEISGDFTETLNRVNRYYDKTGASEVTSVSMTKENLIHYRRVFLSWYGQRMLDERRFQLSGEGEMNFQDRVWQYIAIDDIEYAN